jgi:3',5'-cyclic AMP phosphodiesterase CpdA
MRLLAHLSDVHFGAIDPPLVAAVEAHLHALRPDITVISGDLTQRARRSEFNDARAFLDRLPGKRIVVPGNHDVPLWNVFARFLEPLTGYCRFITRDLTPAYYDSEVAIIGINTARSWTRKSGRINEQQAEEAAQQLRVADPGAIKIVVTHHPFDLSETQGAGKVVGRAKMALAKLAEAGADVLLAGHFHEAYTGGTAKRYPIHGYSALVVQAGTATSSRTRGTSNSFNILRIDPPKVEVEILTWNAGAGKFEPIETKCYERRPEIGFVRIDQPA